MFQFTVLAFMAFTVSLYLSIPLMSAHKSEMSKNLRGVEDNADSYMSLAMCIHLVLLGGFCSLCSMFSYSLLDHTEQLHHPGIVPVVFCPMIWLFLREISFKETPEGKDHRGLVYRFASWLQEPSK